MLKILCFQKNAYICNTEKNQLKLAIMKKENKRIGEKKYRITIIFTDEIIIEKFENEYIAKNTLRNMKELFPTRFVGAALEEKNKSWDVIWTLGNSK
jgi:hypothetical protein